MWERRPGQPGTPSLATPASPDGAEATDREPLRGLHHPGSQTQGSWSQLLTSEHTLCVLGPSFRAANKLLEHFAPKNELI